MKCLLPALVWIMQDIVPDILEPVVDSGIVGLLGWIIGVLGFVVTTVVGLWWKHAKEQLAIRTAEVAALTKQKDDILVKVTELMVRTQETVKDLVRKTEGASKEETAHQATVVTTLKSIQNELEQLRNILK